MSLLPANIEKIGEGRDKKFKFTTYYFFEYFSDGKVELTSKYMHLFKGTYLSLNLSLTQPLYDPVSSPIK